MKTLLKIYMLCLPVCLYPINVKTAEPIGPTFCVGSHMTPGKVYRRIKLQKKFVFFVRF